MTIHYITIHHATTKWIDIQLRHIQHFTRDYKVWALFSKDLRLSEHEHKYHFLGHKKSKSGHESDDHEMGLTQLTNTVCTDPNVSEDDILIFLDSDALPIGDINNYIQCNLEEYEFGAVNRIENLGCLAPHPSFAFCKVKFWKDNQFHWGRDKSFDSNVDWRGDVGGILFKHLNDKGISWLKIQRNSKKSLFIDPLLYCTYGDIVYHHCAGSRGVFKTRATPSYMLDEKNKEFFSKIYSEAGNYIWETINSDYFIELYGSD